MTVTQLLEQIRTIRKKQKISQGALAEKIYVTQLTISRTEVGKNMPQLDTFISMAEGLGYEVVLREKE